MGCWTGAGKVLIPGLRERPVFYPADRGPGPPPGSRVGVEVVVDPGQGALALEPDEKVALAFGHKFRSVNTRGCGASRGLTGEGEFELVDQTYHYSFANAASVSLNLGPGRHQGRDPVQKETKQQKWHGRVTFTKLKCGTRWSTRFVAPGSQTGGAVRRYIMRNFAILFHYIFCIIM